MATKQLTKEEVLHLAHLAHLTISDEEIETYRSQLSSIIDYISKLNELNTVLVEPANQVTGLENVLRDDALQVERQFTQKEATANKKEIKKGMFEVGAVFENNE